MMTIETYDSGLLHSNMYVITENNHAIVIDPCLNTEPGNNRIVDWIVLTHEHYDHISGVNAWKKETEGTVLCSKACADRLGDPRKTLARIFPEFCQLQTWFPLDSIPQTDTEYRSEADQTFDNELTISWEGHEIRLTETPGHSPGSVIILLDNRYLFSGDTLFEDRPIELRFPGGNAKKWKERSEIIINQLPDGLQVFPGHFGTFILNGHQRRKEG